jgi:hypothetical protein
VYTEETKSKLKQPYWVSPTKSSFFPKQPSQTNKHEKPSVTTKKPGYLHNRSAKIPSPFRAKQPFRFNSTDIRLVYPQPSSFQHIRTTCSTTDTAHKKHPYVGEHKSYSSDQKYDYESSTIQSDSYDVDQKVSLANQSMHPTLSSEEEYTPHTKKLILKKGTRVAVKFKVDQNQPNKKAKFRWFNGTVTGHKRDKHNKTKYRVLCDGDEKEEKIYLNSKDRVRSRKGHSKEDAWIMLTKTQAKHSREKQIQFGSTSSDEFSNTDQNINNQTRK